MKKGIIGICLLIFILIFQYAAASDGTCGNNVAYTINGNTISFSKSDPDSDAGWDYDCVSVFRNDSAITKAVVNDVISVPDGFRLFFDLPYIQQMDLSKLDVSDVTSMSEMFLNSSSLTELDLTDWDFSNVTDMSRIFESCSSLQSLDVSNWDVSHVTNMSLMFNNCNSLQNLDVSRWDVSNVTDMGSMFGTPLLKKIDVKNWDVSKVTDMFNMFGHCSSLEELDVSKWDTSSVTIMQSMFVECESLENLDVSDWDTSNVIDMEDMFGGCISLKHLDVSRWNTSNLKTVESLFSNCHSLETIDVSNWDTSNVTNNEGMNAVFYACSSLKELDLRNWDTANAADMSWMFGDLPALERLILGSEFTFHGGEDPYTAFYGTTPDRWKYIEKDTSVVNDDVPLGTIMSSSELQRSYDGDTMAGTWVPVKKVTVTFDPNGGIPDELNYQYFYEEESAGLDPNPYTRDGWNFIGWNTNADGSGENYEDGQTITIDTDLTLYAQWKEKSDDPLPEPFKYMVEIFLIGKDGEPGFPADMNETMLELKLSIKEGDEIVSESETINLHVPTGSTQLKFMVPFTEEVKDLAENDIYKIIAGLEPKKIEKSTGSDNGESFYSVSVKEPIGTYLNQEDGKTHIRVYLVWEETGESEQEEINPKESLRFFLLSLPELPKTGFSSLHFTKYSEQPLSLRYDASGLTLMIPSVDLNTEIVTVPFMNGEYPVEWLGNRAGMLEGSAIPGEGYTVLTGHNHLNTTEAGPFALLSSVSEGDSIFVIDARKNMKTFLVCASEKIASDDIPALERIAAVCEGSLTLLTCEDESTDGGYISRRVVTACPADR